MLQRQSACNVTYIAEIVDTIKYSQYTYQADSNPSHKMPFEKKPQGFHYA